MIPRTRRSLTLIAISLALASVAALLAGRWMTSRAAAVDASRPQAVRLVAAAINIPFGTVIEPRHLTTMAVLTSARPKGSYIAANEVIGKVPKGDVFTGEILLAERLVQPGEGSTLAAVVSPNMRAVTVRVDDVVGVGGFVLPGNRVDVITAREENGRAQAETLLERVKVLAVDQQASADRSAPVVVRAVTLEVTPEGAEAIARARQQGTIQLALRNPTDESVYVHAAPPTPTEIAAVPAVAAAPPRVRIPRREPAPVMSVIRGTTLSDQRISDARTGE